MQDSSDRLSLDWRRPFWLLLLVGASVAFSFGFACAMPFAGFCAAAACTLPRRDAYCLTGAIWLVNQGVGFVFLHYSWTATCLAWGGIMGLSAVASTVTARQTLLRLRETPSLARNALAFLAAFFANEAILIAFSFWLGGLKNFTAGIPGKIFALNAIAFVGLFALNWAGKTVGIAGNAPSGRRQGALVEAEG